MEFSVEIKRLSSRQTEADFFANTSPTRQTLKNKRRRKKKPPRRSHKAILVAESERNDVKQK